MVMEINHIGNGYLNINDSKIDEFIMEQFLGERKFVNKSYSEFTRGQRCAYGYSIGDNCKNSYE